MISRLAFEWYEQSSTRLGSEFFRAVDGCFALIGRNPLVYPKVYHQVRRALIRRFPYGVMYRLVKSPSTNKSRI